MNLKLTKTAIRELTRLYRGVLVAAFIASALVASGANADTTLTKEALLADLNDTEYTDGHFDTLLGTQYVSGGDWADEYAQYTFDSNNDGEADAQLAGKLAGDTTIDFTQTAFQFTDQNGDTTDLATHSTGLTTSDFDKAATVIAAEAGASAHSGSNLTTTTTVAQNTYSYKADTTGTGTPTLHTLTDDAPVLTDFSKTITLTGSQNNGDVVVTGDSDAGMPQQEAYTFTIIKADSTESSTISWVKTGSSYTINASVEGDLDDDADMAAAIAKAKLEFEAYSNDVTAYNNAKTTNATNLAAATDNYNTVNSAYEADTTAQESITANYNNYTTSYAIADTNRTAANSALSTAFGNYTTDVAAYTAAKDAVDTYDNSISVALDARTQDQIDVALADGGAIKGAIDTVVGDLTFTGDNVVQPGSDVTQALTALDTAIGNNTPNAETGIYGLIATETQQRTEATTTYDAETYAASNYTAGDSVVDAIKDLDTVIGSNGETPSGLKGQIGDASDITSAMGESMSISSAINKIVNGDQDVTGSMENKIASIVGTANTATGDDPSNATGLFAAIDTLNGDANTAGSVAKALADAKDYTDALATGAVQDNTDAITTLNGDASVTGSVENKIATIVGSANTATGDDPSNATGLFAAVDTLNGDEETAGSVAYAVAQEASARDTAISAATTMGATDGKNYTAGSSVISAIESIDTNMGKIHGLIGSDGSFNGTATSTNMDGTTYKGNLAVGTTVEDHLVALDNTIGIMSNLTTTEKTTVVGAINEVDAKIGTTTDGTYVAAANTVGQNLNALDSALGDVRSDMASTQASNERRFAQIDRRIDKLEDKMEKGLAANNALASLVPLDHTHTTQISAAMGGYGSSQALAIGAFHYLNDRTLLNAGVGYGGNSNMSYKVGVTFGF